MTRSEDFPAQRIHSNTPSHFLLMSKRSRDACLSSVSDKSLSPEAENESDLLESHAPPAKFLQISSDSLARFSAGAMQCSLAPHKEVVSFDTHEDYEIHYTKEHTNRCATCSKNFPSARFLELHIEENHNVLREALAARGEKTYGCFVDDCDRKCSTPQKRRLHLIDKHMFPKTYNFRVIDQGIDKAVSMLRDVRRRRVSTANHHQQASRHQRQLPTPVRNQASEVCTDEKSEGSLKSNGNRDTARLDYGRTDSMSPVTAADEQVKRVPDDLDGLTRSLSSLRFVPTSVLRTQKRMAVDQDTRQSKSAPKTAPSP